MNLVVNSHQHQLEEEVINMNNATITTKKRANELTKLIREGLQNAEQALREFIAGEGWVVLGYDNFVAYYDEQLSDLVLASALRPIAVLKLLEAGEDPEEVPKKVKGVGPATVTSIQRQRKAGVPAEKLVARGGYRPHSGRRPSHFRIDVGVERHQQITEIAEAYGQSAEECLLEAIDTYLAYWLPQIQEVA